MGVLVQAGSSLTKPKVFPWPKSTPFFDSDVRPWIFAHTRVLYEPFPNDRGTEFVFVSFTCFFVLLDFLGNSGASPWPDVFGGKKKHPYIPYYFSNSWSGLQNTCAECQGLTRKNELWTLGGNMCDRIWTHIITCIISIGLWESSIPF